MAQAICDTCQPFAATSCQAGAISIAEAVQHVLLMPDGVRAAQLIEHHGLQIMASGQIQTALVWLSQLPEELRHIRPMLNILHALALLLTSDLEGAEARLQEAEGSIRPDTSPAEAGITRGNAAAIRANIALHTGDLAAYGEQVLSLLPTTEVIARTMAHLHVARAFRVTGDVTSFTERRATAAVGPIRESGNRLGHLGAVINLARLQELQGRPRAAATTYRELVQIAGGPDELRGLHGALLYLVGLGDLHREWNELDRAGEHLSQAMALRPGGGMYTPVRVAGHGVVPLLKRVVMATVAKRRTFVLCFRAGGIGNELGTQTPIQY